MQLHAKLPRGICISNPICQTELELQFMHEARNKLSINPQKQRKFWNGTSDGRKEVK